MRSSASASDRCDRRGRSLGIGRLYARAGDGVLAPASGHRDGDGASGLNGAAAAQNLAHRTRRSKDRRDEESLRAEWRERAHEYGIELARPVAYAPAMPEHTKAEVALEYSVSHNSEREAVIDRRALEAVALQHGQSRS